MARAARLALLQTEILDVLCGSVVSLIETQLVGVLLVVQVQDDLSIQLDVLLGHGIWQWHGHWVGYWLLQLHLRMRQWRRLWQHHRLHIPNAFDHAVVPPALHWPLHWHCRLLCTGIGRYDFHTALERNTGMHGAQVAEHVILPVDRDLALYATVPLDASLVLLLVAGQGICIVVAPAAQGTG